MYQIWDIEIVKKITIKKHLTNGLKYGIINTTKKERGNNNVYLHI